MLDMQIYFMFLGLKGFYMLFFHNSDEVNRVISEGGRTITGILEIPDIPALRQELPDVRRIPEQYSSKKSPEAVNNQSFRGSSDS